MRPLFLDTANGPLSRKTARLLLLISGLCTGVCVTFSVGLLQWVSLTPAMYVLFRLLHDEAQEASEARPVRLRRIYAAGLLFFMSYYLVCFHWFLYMYPLEFVGLDRASALFVVVFAWWGLSALQALGGALVFVAFVAMVRGISLLRRIPLLQVLLLPALWVVFEWTQTLGWAGVPWGRLALGQMNCLPLLQTASLLGSYLISLAILLVNAAVAYLLLSPSRWRMGASIVAATLVLMLGSGTLLWFANAPAQEEQTVQVAAIQGNIGSADKWDMSAAQCWDIYISMTDQAARSGAELIIWPETAVPIVLKNKTSYCEELSELAQEYGVTVMVGAFTAGEGGSYNSILTMQPDGSFSDTVYSKRHLVPFGEYVPMKDVIMTLVPALGELSRFVDGLLPGESACVISTEYGRVGSLICFDSIYEELALDSVRNGAQLLAISTNDSWFFDSAAVRMHSAQAQLRAIETGRYVLRSANTGISSVISARGEILDTLPALCDGVLIGEVALQDGTTLYTRVGNLLVYLCIGFGASLALCGMVDRCKKSKNKE